MSEDREVTFRLNGRPERMVVPARMHLVDALRARFQLSSPRVGCEHGVCGSCTLRLDGELVRGCLVLGAQVEGQHVETLEGLTETGEIRDLQDMFVARNATQCGFCTPAMLITCAELLRDGERRSREEIRDHISGNLCRCTGYEAIVDAVERVMEARLAGQRRAA